MATIATPAPEVYRSPTYISCIYVYSNFTFLLLIKDIITSYHSFNNTTNQKSYFQSTILSNVDAGTIVNLSAAGSRVRTVKSINQLSIIIGRNGNQFYLKGFVELARNHINESSLHGSGQEILILIARKNLLPLAGTWLIAISIFTNNNQKTILVTHLYDVSIIILVATHICIAAGIGDSS